MFAQGGDLDLKPWEKDGMRLVRGMLIFILVVMVLLAAVAGLVSWKGRQDWEATQKELTAKGEKLRVEELVPAAVADEPDRGSGGHRLQPRAEFRHAEADHLGRCRRPRRRHAQRP